MAVSVPPIPRGRAGEATPMAPQPADWDVRHVGFHDVLSALNPLQYLPGVGMIYPAVSGDEIHPALKIAVAGAASFLIGGPIGLVAAMIGAVAIEVAHGTPHDAAHWQEAASAYGRAARAA
jgi:hypothetical protein